MNISLTPRLEKLVKRKVASGLYHSASEVIRESLRFCENYERLHQAQVSALKRDIEEALASGPSTPLDIEKIKKKARRRFSKNAKNS